MTTATRSDPTPPHPRDRAEGAAPDARALLAEAKRVTEPALRSAVQRLDAANHEMAAFHLGWIERDGSPGRGGGKALRPALALLSATAAGGARQTGLPGAVAVELLHNFSLVHDDLMDGDTERRHRPTVWSCWGSSSAVLLGDALQSLAHEVLLEAESPQAARAALLLAETTRELIRGQVEDLGFEERTGVSLAECQRMAAAKTAALLSASAAIGAVLAGAPEGTVRALTGFGFELGMAFQLVDDLLGIWGDPATTGKPVYSDLRSRKKTLPISYAAGCDRPAGRELARWLDRGDPPQDPELPAVADLVERAGGREWAQTEALRRIAAAEAELAAAPLDQAARQAMQELARFAAGRSA